MGQQVGRVGEPGAGLQHQPPPQHQQQPRGLRGSSAARPAGRRREAAGRTAEGGGFNIFTQHGEGPGRAGGAGAGEGGGGSRLRSSPARGSGGGARGKGRDLPSSLPPSFVVVGFTGGGESWGSWRGEGEAPLAGGESRAAPAAAASRGMLASAQPAAWQRGRGRRNFPRSWGQGGTARPPLQKRGGTAGNQNLQCLVAVKAAVPSSGFVYKGKRYMCFVFLFTEALITRPSRSVILCCYIAPDRANDFVLTGVLQLPSDSQLKFLPVHFYSYCCKLIPEMFNAT